MKHENQFDCDVPPIDPKDPFPETHPGSADLRYQLYKDGVEKRQAEQAWQVLENARLDRLAIEADRRAGRFTALPISKLTSTPVRKRWLVKGIIAAGETSAWIAPPGG